MKSIESSRASTEISVIIPFYQRINFTVEAVRSVLEQDYSNWELILVDDGSTENLEPLQSLIANETRVRLIHQSHKGVSAARNRGIAEATSPYIAFLDSDDLWAPNKLSTQLNYMEDNGFLISHTSYRRMSVDGTLLEEMHSGLQCGKVYPKIISSCGIATPTVMVKREVLQNMKTPFSEDFHIGEDICLWIQLGADHEFGGIDQPLTYVRIGESTASLSSEKQLIGLSNILSFVNRNPRYRTEFLQTSRLWKTILIYKNLTKKPLVSIVIPVYNGSNYLREAIDSALAQTYPNIEVIVINDGSRDEGATETIALSYGDRIRYYSKENGGVATALNMGIQKMNGEYFSWLSHDDLYKPEKIEKELKFILDSGKEDTIVAGGYDVVNADGEYLYGVNISTLYPQNRISNPLFVLLRGGIHGCAMLIHKSHFERVGMFDESLPSTQDYDLWFRMFQDCPFNYYKDNYVLSRSHEEQNSRKMENHLRDCNKLWIWMMQETSPQKRLKISGSDVAFFEEMYTFLSSVTNYTEAISYAKEQEEREYQKRIAEMLQSKSWRITAPLRMIKKPLAKIGIEKESLFESDTVSAKQKWEAMQNSRSWRYTNSLRQIKKGALFLRKNGFWKTVEKVGSKMSQRSNKRRH